MKTINRQKFLAELGKLLTFMYEEDRQLALSIYERMFDAAEDEQVIIQRLISPTKQAVMVARAYDAKERRLSVSSSSKDEAGYHEDAEETPQFVYVINRIFEEIFPDRTPAQEMVEDQLSFFDAGAAYTEENADAPEEDAGEVPEDAAYRAEDILEEMKGFAEEQQDAVQPREEPEPDAAKTEPAEEPEITEAEEQPAVPDEEPETEGREEEPAQTEDSAKESDSAETLPESEPEETPEQTEASAVEKTPRKKRKKTEVPTKTATNVPLKILFLVVAIPVTLALVLLLLVPTACSFALAAAAIALGATLILAAFGGFAVLADILVLTGAAVIFLALGLLFLWLGIWLIGGGIVGLIRGMRRLGRRWYRKEVPAE